MLQLRMLGFMSHSDSTYEIPMIGATCVRGPNGAGKSHLYGAIRWVLFPKKGDDVHPLGTNEKVEVQLKFPGNVIITRTATTNTIRVRVNGKTFTGNDADTRIEKMFGCRKTWDLCSHFESNRHPFVSASGPQKIEMINCIVGGDDEIKVKLASRLAAAKTAMVKSSEVYNKKKIQHIARYGSDFSSIDAGILTEDDIAKYKSTSASLKRDVIRYEDELVTLNILEAREQTLLDVVNGIRYTDKELKRLTNTKAMYDAYSSKLSKYKALSKDSSIEAKMYTDDAIHEHMLNAKLYEANSLICKSLGVPYDSEDVCKLIKECQEQIASRQVIVDNHAQLVDEYKAKCIQRDKVISENQLILDAQLCKADKYKKKQLELRAVQVNSFKQQLDVLRQQLEQKQQVDVDAYKTKQRKYSKKLLENERIHDVIKEHRKLTSQLTDTIEASDAINIEEKLSALVKQLSKLETNMRYTDLFESYKKLDVLTKQLAEVQLSNKSLNSVESLASMLTRSIDNRWIIEARKAYEVSYLSAFPTHNSAEISPSVVTDEIFSTKQQLKDIKLSSVVKRCPSCACTLSIVNEDIVKYEGKIVTGNVDTLQKRLVVLEKLRIMKYPDLPVLELNTEDSIESMKVSLECATNAGKLINQISQYSTLQALPDGIKYVTRESGEREHRQLKKEINTYEQAVLIMSRLKVLGVCPEEPESLAPIKQYVCVKIEDDNEYKKLNKTYITLINSPLPAKENKIELLPVPEEPKQVQSLQSLLRGLDKYDNPEKILATANSVVFLDRPLHSVQYMKDCSALFIAKSELDKVEKVDRVTEREVLSYASDLGVYKSATMELETVQESIDKIDVTDKMLASAKSKLEHALQSIELHHRSIIIKDSYTELKKVKAVHTKATTAYDRVAEFKEIVETELKQIIIGFVSGIENDVNSFLETLESPVSLNIIYTDKIKLVCFKNGLEVGKPNRLSQGEQSLLSFAITVSFSIQSPSSILILDEITDKLSPENKDKAIELLLDTLKETKKCLLITDHNCHCGDYDKIIDINGRPPKDEDEEIIDSEG